MRRVHLAEIEDQRWCPTSLRDAMTDFLRGAFHLLGQYRPAAPLLAAILEEEGQSRLVDLGSGAGGPWPDLLFRLEALLPAGSDPVRVLLTDLYPNRRALEEIAERAPRRIEWDRRPVDARHVPRELAGLRTLFTAFHHFEPDDARKILADAVDAGQPVAVLEVTQRRFLAMLVLALGVAPLCLVLAPFLRPFRWSRLFWTYVLPLAPLAAAWDGLVSCLRSYRPSELREMAASAGGDDWTWTTREIAYWRGWSPVPVTALIGRPPADRHQSGGGSDGKGS